MAGATTTLDYRKRLATQMSGGAVVKPPAMIAFGDGGHNPDNTAKTPSDSQTELVNERLRKNLSQLIKEDDYSITGSGIAEKADLNGVSISEAGLLDEDGKLLGFKNFAPKIKESDEEYEIKVKLKF
jgi:phage-related tail fiber protein